jgi:hypothetical protein
VTIGDGTDVRKVSVIPTVRERGGRPRAFGARERPVLGLVCLVSVLVAIGGPIGEAQRPERSHDVYVPEVGVTLEAGWQLIFYDHCQLAIPASWGQPSEQGVVLAPDGAVTAAINDVPIVSWFAHKAQIKAQVGASGHRLVVHEDGPHRFWCEFSDDTRLTHYVAVLNGDMACVGQVELRRAGTSVVDLTIKRIIESVAPTSTTNR